MTSTQNKIEELMSRLGKASPRSCSKPKSEMCSKCIDRTYSNRSIQIQSYIKDLRELQTIGKTLPASTENLITELLSTK